MDDRRGLLMAPEITRPPADVGPQAAAFEDSLRRAAAERDVHLIASCSDNLPANHPPYFCITHGEPHPAASIDGSQERTST